MIKKRFILSALATLALIGCNNATSPLTQASADVVGVLASVKGISDDGTVRILLHDLSVRPPGASSGQLYLLANAQTPVYIRDADQGRRRGTVNDLTVGALVLAKVGDVVLDSSPAQFSAVRIEAEQ